MTAVIIAMGMMTISIFDTTSLFLIDIFLSTDILVALAVKNKLGGDF